MASSPSQALSSIRPSTLSMSTYSIPASAAAAVRTAILASSDLSFRRRVSETLSGLRWQVREAGGGAEALAMLEALPAEALILDSWLPDLEIREFVREFERLHPQVDLIAVDGTVANGGRGATRSPRRNELLHAVRSGQDAVTPAPATFSIPASKAAIDLGSGAAGSDGDSRVGIDRAAKPESTRVLPSAP